MICPYCHKKTKEVLREEQEGYDDMSVEIIYQCTSCNKEAVLILVKDGWVDLDDNPIDEDL